MITATAAVMQAARAAVEFINRETGGNDLVIMSPEWAWLLRAHVADFQQAMAAEGHATTHFPGDIPPDQFALDGERQIRRMTARGATGRPHAFRK